MTLKTATLITLCILALAALNNVLMLFDTGFGRYGYLGHIINNVLPLCALVFFLFTLYRKQP